MLEIQTITINHKRILKIAFLIVFAGLFLWEGFQYIIDRLFGTTLFFDVAQDIKIDFLEDIALMLLVAIPLPLTETWTASVAAFVFGIPFKRALPFIAASSMIASLVMLLYKKRILN